MGKVTIVRHSPGDPSPYAKAMIFLSGKWPPASRSYAGRFEGGSADIGRRIDVYSSSPVLAADERRRVGKSAGRDIRRIVSAIRKSAMTNPRGP
jgi:hypothetical protein